MHDNDPATLEREKHRNLTGEQLKTPHIKSAPGWNENLASSSEAYIKADKHPHDETIEDLQRETVEYVHTRHSPEERISGRESAEKLDEVIGPLGGKVLQKRTVKETKEEVVEEDNQAISKADFCVPNINKALTFFLRTAPIRGEPEAEFNLRINGSHIFASSNKYILIFLEYSIILYGNLLYLCHCIDDRTLQRGWATYACQVKTITCHDA